MTIALIVCALIQIAIGVLNFFLPRMLGWRPALDRLPLLVREVFWVHLFFLAVTLFIFGGLTLWQGTALGPLAFCIGLFWAFRVAIQLVYYDPSHRQGKRFETIVHWTLLVVYSGMATVYFNV